MSNTSQSQPLSFTVSLRLPRPASEVYQAIADPVISCRYFMQSASGPIVAGATLTWTWKSSPPIRVQVDEALPGKGMQFRWAAPQGMNDTTVAIELTAESSSQTLVRISESGWPSTADGLSAAFDNCAGWQHMLLCLKAWLVHGIELR